jgi:hypothetical protein
MEIIYGNYIWKFHIKLHIKLQRQPAFSISLTSALGVLTFGLSGMHLDQPGSEVTGVNDVAPIQNLNLRWLEWTNNLYISLDLRWLEWTNNAISLDLRWLEWTNNSYNWTANWVAWVAWQKEIIQVWIPQAIVEKLFWNCSCTCFKSCSHCKRT